MIKHSNGNLAFQGFIQNGQKIDMGYEYYPNGDKKYLGQFKNGEYAETNPEIYNNSVGYNHKLLWTGSNYRYKNGLVSGRGLTLWTNLHWPLIKNGSFVNGILDTTNADKNSKKVTIWNPTNYLQYKGGFAKGIKNGYGELLFAPTNVI